MKIVKKITILVASLLVTGMKGMNKPGLKTITIASKSDEQELVEAKHAADCSNQTPIDDPIFEGRFPNVIQGIIREYAIHPVDYFQAATTRKFCNANDLDLEVRLNNGTVVKKLRIGGHIAAIYELEDETPSKVLFTLRHRDHIRALKVMWGDYVLVYSTDRTVGIWNGLTGECLQSLVDDSRDDSAAQHTTAYNFEEQTSAVKALQNLPQSELKGIQFFIMQLEVNKHFKKVGDTSGFVLSGDLAKFFVSLPKAIQGCICSHYVITIDESSGCCVIL